MKTFKHRFNLQFFAEEESTGTNEPEVTETEEKKYTQADIDKMISTRLKKEQVKFQKKLEEEKAEERRLAEMDAAQRAEEEHKKRLAALEEREARLKMAEDKIECEKVLKERNLDPAMAQFLLSSDNEKTLENINAFEKAFKDAVQVAVNERIKGKTPQSGAPEGSKQGMTKEEFSKLPLHKKNELYLSDPETYKQLMNQ